MLHSRSLFKLLAGLVVGALVLSTAPVQAFDLNGQSLGSARAPHAGPLDFSSYQWQPTLTTAPWAARAGLQVVELNDALYLMGGRTPLNPAIVPLPGASTLWSDVWKSRDLGSSWETVLETDGADHWPARAYFQALTHRGRMFVMGGSELQARAQPGLRVRATRRAVRARRGAAVRLLQRRVEQP